MQTEFTYTRSCPQHSKQPKPCGAPLFVWSPHADCAVQKHMNSLGLDVLEHCTERGLHLRIREDDDPRIAKVTAMSRGRAFWTGTPKAEHTLRAVARVRTLQMVVLSRWDSEGIDDADVDIVSRLPWKKWYASLSTKCQGLLWIYRAGAVHSSTRAQRDRSNGFALCVYCGFHTPSFRHWWSNCPRFNDDRATAASCSKLSPFPHSFWNLAPRCTSKFGWITYTASTDADARAHFAIAAAQVALAVMDATEALMDLDVSGAMSSTS
ncbi:unnamed protein product [Polarella glacialis]|uniref:Uncharacterized protein n=2 Tax=Polarella glacialis TaxID=89957 RepID=A0A813HRT5_POLGL|nr:unnamed protein product [Polarella glacialis]